MRQVWLRQIEWLAQDCTKLSPGSLSPVFAFCTISVLSPTEWVLLNTWLFWWLLLVFTHVSFSCHSWSLRRCLPLGEAGWLVLARRLRAESSSITQNLRAALWFLLPLQTHPGLCSYKTEAAWIPRHIMEEACSTLNLSAGYTWGW